MPCGIGGSDTAGTGTGGFSSGGTASVSSPVTSGGGSVRVISASAEYVLRDILVSWPASPDAISPEATEHYLRAFTAETIPGICAEYRASFHIDRRMDTEDREAGRRIQAPVLVHWGSEEGAMSDSLQVWRRWADSVEGGPLPSGHFIPEEAPEALAAALQLARRGLRVLRQNFAWSLAYNLVAIPLAAFGWIGPLGASIGMAASSLLVVANSLRISTREVHAG